MAAGLRGVPGYPRVWTAAALSSFGSSVTVLAVQVLATLTLGASATGIGLVSAARWLPYLLFGLFAGVVADRYRRRPLLVSADAGRALLLVAIPVLYATHGLTVASLAAVVFGLGALSLLFDAADQSFLPGLVPRDLLTAANARIEQADSVAQTMAPLVAGGLIRVIGAPLAVLIDALSYVVSAVLLVTLRVREPAPTRTPTSVWLELRDGADWVYRRSGLVWTAVTSHVRFVFSSLLSTVYIFAALRPFDLGPAGLGIAYAAGGVGAVMGGGLATRLGRRWPVGRIVVATRGMVPVAWLPLAVAPPGRWDLPVAAAVQLLTWIALGIESPNELGYRATITPGRLLGRMSATIRSLNWGMVTIGAPLGGYLTDRYGYRSAAWIGIAGLAAAAVALAASPFRRARWPEP